MRAWSWLIAPILGILSARCGGDTTITARPADKSKGGEPRDAGAPPPVSRFPCEHPKPVTGDSGYVACADGTVHRPFKATCPTPVPRPDFIAPDDGVLKRCWKDSDCAHLGAHGYCQYIGPFPLNTPGYYCVRGCASDDECDGYDICVCDGFVGHCSSTSCQTDDDCISGFLCRSQTDFCNPRFDCETPQDQCMTRQNCQPADICLSGAVRHCGQPCVF